MISCDTCQLNLYKLIESLESKYIKPYSVLEKELKSIKPYTNKYTAFTFIIGEIKILLFYKKLAEEFMGQLKGLNKKTNTQYQIYETIVKQIMG